MARNFSGWPCVKSSLLEWGWERGVRLCSETAFSARSGTRDCTTSPLMSSAKRRRMRETGALPGRKPGTRATRANSLATRSIALVTSSAGISRSSSRRQVASAMLNPFLGELGKVRVRGSQQRPPVGNTQANLLEEARQVRFTLQVKKQVYATALSERIRDR